MPLVLMRICGQRMTPARIASATIWARSPVPSLRPIRDRWLLTVSADRLSASPISLLDWPSATSCSTSTSRAESSASPEAAPAVIAAEVEEELEEDEA